MATIDPTSKARASEICEQIRWVLAIHPSRVGWFARPHHTNKQIKIGHKDFGSDPDITAECETLLATCQLLGIGEDLGYSLSLSAS